MILEDAGHVLQDIHIGSMLVKVTLQEEMSVLVFQEQEHPLLHHLQRLMIPVDVGLVLQDGHIVCEFILSNILGFNAGLAAAPGGDQCACVRQSSTPTTTTKASTTTTKAPTSTTTTTASPTRYDTRGCW